MIDLVNVVVLVLTGLLFVLSSYIYKKVNLLKLLILILEVALVGIWELKHSWLEAIEFRYLEETYQILLIVFLMVMSLTFKHKIKVTNHLTDHDFFEMENKLKNITDSAELLRKRFIHSIELLNEGLMFYEPNGTGVYLTDQIKVMIHTEKNQLTMEEYTSLIHKEDQKRYLQTIKKTSQKINTYEVKYRIQTETGYAWTIEKGRLFNHQKKAHIIATFKPVNIKLFPDTMIEELDSLPFEEDLLKTISNLRKEKQTFYLAMLHLTNIPDVNKRFGRDVGNLMIAEYVKNMRYHFAREKNTLFRITGIQFALVLKDDIKYQNLHRALMSGGDLINLKLSIGGIQQIIYPNVGIVKSDPWSHMNVNDLFSLSNKALEEAISDNKNNYAIFGGK